MVQVSVERGDYDVVILVLKIGELLGQEASVMVVDKGDSSDD